MVGICAAVTRMAESGDTVLARESISILDALRMYTLGAAEAAFEEGIKGSITPGKLADLVVLNQNPCGVDPGSIKDIDPGMTVIGGRIVWSDGTLSP